MSDGDDEGADSASDDSDGGTSQAELGPGKLGLELSIVNEDLRDLLRDHTLPPEERELNRGFYTHEQTKLRLQIAILDKKEKSDSNEKARSELSAHLAELERLIQEDSKWEERRTAARRWELSRQWEAITPDELRPAVEAIRHSFEHKGWWQAQQSSMKLCYAALHPSPPKEEVQTNSDDLIPYKTFLEKLIGQHIGPSLLGADHPEPVIFKSYLDILIIALRMVVRAEFCKLYDIARVRPELLNMHPVEWVKRHFEILISAQKCSTRIWFRNVCDKPDWSREKGSDDEIYWGYWRAPRFIHMHPAGNTPYHAATAWAREGLARSLELLDVRADRLITFVGFELDDNVRAAHVEFVKEDGPRASGSTRVGGYDGPSPPSSSLPVKGIQSSEVWRSLHDRFTTMAAEELALAPRNTGDRWLRAYVDYKNRAAEGGQWHVSSGVTESFRERFEVEATRAGIAIGSALACEPRDVWLHHVFSDLLAHNSKLLFSATKEGGIIVRACEASAIYCARLEKQALIEGIKAASDPTIPVQAVTAPPSHGQKATPKSPKDQQTDMSLREAVIRKIENPQTYTVLSIPEAALYFEVKPRTIHRWTADGKLKNGGRRGSITIQSIRRLEKERSRKRLLL